MREKRWTLCFQFATFLLFLLAKTQLAQCQYGAQNSRCNYDPNCFSCSSNCALAKAKPYERRTPVSCEECLNMCLSSSYGSYSCQTMVYDTQFRSCDLFSVSKSYNYPAVNYACRDMCVPTGRCSGATVPPITTQSPIPTEATCPPGEVAKYLSAKDARLTGIPTQTLNLPTREACVQACTNNRNSNGNSMPCRAVVFTPGSCEIYMNIASGGSASIIPASGSEYLEKICLPDDSSRGCGNIIEQYPNYRLVGFATDVVTAGNYDQCIRECLANPGCLSGMFFPTDSVDNCILNGASKDTNPDLFGPDDFGDGLVYFQPDCPRRGGFRRRQPAWQRLSSRSSDPTSAKKLFEDFILKDEAKRKATLQRDGVRLGSWAHWSNCDLTTNTQVRYQICSEVDIRECPNEVEKCSSFGSPIENSADEVKQENALGLGKCVCTVDGMGKTRCDVGLRRIRIGSRYVIERCDNPTASG